MAEGKGSRPRSLFTFDSDQPPASISQKKEAQKRKDRYLIPQHRGQRHDPVKNGRKPQQQEEQQKESAEGRRGKKDPSRCFSEGKFAVGGEQKEQQEDKADDQRGRGKRPELFRAFQLFPKPAQGNALLDPKDMMVFIADHQREPKQTGRIHKAEDGDQRFYQRGELNFMQTKILFISMIRTVTIILFLPVK